MLKKIIFLLTALLFCTAIANAAEQTKQKPEMTPQGIKKAWQEIGTFKLFERLTEADADIIYTGIAKGDEGWISTVPYIHPNQNASDNMWVKICLAEALPKNPTAVLMLQKYDISLDLICATPFLEPEPEFLTDYFKRAEAALDTVTEPTLQKAKNDCLRYLNKAKQQ